MTLKTAGGRTSCVKFAAGIMLLLFTSMVTFAQENGYGICSACKSLDNKIKSLESEHQWAAKNLQETKSQYYAEKVKDLLQAIQQKKGELWSCMLSKCGGKLDLNASFSGKATVTISGIGSFNRNVNASVLFLRWDHKHLQISLSPVKSPPFNVPGGTNITTVTGAGGGTVNLNTGAMTVNLSLHFNESNPFGKDSDLLITLSTSSGSPLNGAGKVTLKGSGILKHGDLNNRTCAMTITGTVSPHP
jgi:hypothetical protein